MIQSERTSMWKIAQAPIFSFNYNGSVLHLRWIPWMGIPIQGLCLYHAVENLTYDRWIWQANARKWRVIGDDVGIVGTWVVKFATRSHPNLVCLSCFSNFSMELQFLPHMAMSTSVHMHSRYKWVLPKWHIEKTWFAQHGALRKYVD